MMQMAERCFVGYKKDTNSNLYVVSEETINVWKENLLSGNISYNKYIHIITIDSDALEDEYGRRYISSSDDELGYRAQPLEWNVQNFAMQEEQNKIIDRDLDTYEGSWPK